MCYAVLSTWSSVFKYYTGSDLRQTDYRFPCAGEKGRCTSYDIDYISRCLYLCIALYMWCIYILYGTIQFFCCCCCGWYNNWDALTLIQVFHKAGMLLIQSEGHISVYWTLASGIALHFLKAWSFNYWLWVLSAAYPYGKEVRKLLFIRIIIYTALLKYQVLHNIILVFWFLYSAQKNIAVCHHR